METRIFRDKSKGEDDAPKMSNAITWATLVQNETKEMWNLTDDKIVELVNAQISEMLNYEATHDDLGNPVDAIIIRLGKGGYSVATAFDHPLPTWGDTETCV